MSATAETEARIAVLIPCYDDGDLIMNAIESVQEDEPLEMVVIDDASHDEATLKVLERLAADGVRVIHHGENTGVGGARNTGLGETRARYVFPLDADDTVLPGVLGRMADRLDEHPAADVCFGDYGEFGGKELVRTVPREIDPYRIAYTNEYPVSAMFRRTTLEKAGGWPVVRAYEDWHLWMTLAEQGARAHHMGNTVTYRRRLHGERLLTRARSAHRQLYLRLRDDHPKLFEGVSEHRRNSRLSRRRKLLYPVVYGARPRFGWEPRVKSVLDRWRVWTLRR